MPKKVDKQKEEKAGLKDTLTKAWKRFRPFATSLVLLAAAVALIVAVKKMGPKDESKAAIKRAGEPSFVLKPRTPTRGTDIMVAAEGMAVLKKRYSYRWWLNGVLVEGHDRAVFPGKGLSRGDLVRVEVIDPPGKVVGADSVRVVNAPPVLGEIKFSPLPLSEEKDLKVEVSARDPDGDTVTHTLAWQVNGEDVLGEIGSVLGHDSFSRGDKVRAVATLSDGWTTRTITSAPVLVMNGPPVIVSKPPAMVSRGSYAYQVEAEDPEGDGLRFSLGGSTPPGMSIDPETGLITWEARMPEKPVAYAYQIIVRDGHNGRCVQNVYLEFN